MEGEKKEYQLQAVCFAAATAVLIACLEQAILRSFIHQWRVLMFLALNLLLLAILFTSMSPTSSSNQDFETSNAAKKFKKTKRTKRAKPCSPAEVFADNEKRNNLLRQDDERLVVPEVFAKDGDGLWKHPNHERVIRQVEFIKEVIVEDDLKGEEIDEVDLKEQSFQLSNEELNERVEAFITMFRQHLISDAKEISCRRLQSPFKKEGANFLPKPMQLYATH